MRIAIRMNAAETRRHNIRNDADIPDPDPEARALAETIASGLLRDEGKRLRKRGEVIAAIVEVLWPGGNGEHEWSSSTASDIAGILVRAGIGPLAFDKYSKKMASDDEDQQVDVDLIDNHGRVLYALVGEPD